MAKLHEILAVEGDLEGTAKKILDEAIVTFTKRPEHFLEVHKTLTMFDDARSQENAEEHKALVTTVGDKLDYARRSITKYIDTFAKKETTNQVAKADLVVDGVTLLTEVPATLLLGLETKLKWIRKMYEVIPTLQPGVDWILDETRGKGIYKANSPEVRSRTEKQIQFKILVQPTKEHPAQVEKWNADMPVGRFEIQHWSAMLSPAEKSNLLGRVDTLLRAVKKARQRANSTQVVGSEISIGAVLFDYING